MGTVHHFGCTRCGKCCRGWRLPLSVTEAIAWAERGQQVEVLCQALPETIEPGESDPAAYQWHTSFPAVSGAMPVRIKVVLAANLGDACPHLQQDMGCGIYAKRPLACRIYPAGLDPFALAGPEQKRCPADAWAPPNPVLLRDGDCVDGTYRHVRQQYHSTAIADARVHADLCASLKLRYAALSSVGCVIYRPDGEKLLSALRRALQCGGAMKGRPEQRWTVVSHDEAMADALARIQYLGIFTHIGLQAGDPEWEYLNFPAA